MTHFENLALHIPGLINRRTLDLGSGRGKFLVDVARRGGAVVGFEKNPEYIKLAHERAERAGVSITVSSGMAEHLPYQAGEFEFVNMGEVIEHVDDPSAVLREVHRVLAPGGILYISAPSRYGLKDPHFHLYFINWLPRTWTHAVIGLFGRHEGKEYDGRAGLQRLDEMHYYTRAQLKNLLAEHGFGFRDIRELKLKKMIGTSLLISPLLAVYRLLGPIIFDTFHVLADREDA